MQQYGLGHHNIVCSILMLHLTLAFRPEDFDYCAIGLVLCAGKQHVACPTPEVPEDCEGFKLIALNETHRTLALRLHNELRNKIAMGEEHGGKNGVSMPKAKAMRYVLWDDELAYLASLNLKNCDMMHDKCRKTIRCPRAGQNIGRVRRLSSHYTAEAIIERVIRDWYSEVNMTTQAMIDSYPREKQPLGQGVGHFTQMVRDVSGLVGCALAQYMMARNNKKYHTSVMTCNYERTNTKESPVYVKGEVAAAGCPPDMPRNEHYPGLCGCDEKTLVTKYSSIFHLDSTTKVKFETKISFSPTSLNTSRHP